MAKLYVTPAQFDAFQQIRLMEGIEADSVVREKYIGLISVLVLDGRGEGITSVVMLRNGMQEVELVIENANTQEAYMSDARRLTEALQMALRMYDAGARRSGRTTRMIESVREGDAVVCLNQAHAREIRRLLDDRGLKRVSILTAPGHLGELGHVTARSNRLHIDHCWLHEYFMNEISRAENNIEALVKSREHSAPDEPLASSRSWVKPS
jgi:hypothetical protein